MFKTENIDESSYVHKVYRNIICLGLLLHVLYAVLFGVFQHPLGCLYNIGSTLFYVTMLYLSIKKRCYSVVVSLIHLESCLFAVVHTLFYGWDGTFYMFLVAMASLVYFCPYQRTYIPYLISFFHFSVFFILRIYTLNFAPLFSMNPLFNQILFFGNCICSFMVILYIAYVSKVNAAVSQKELMVQNVNLKQIAEYDQLTGLYSRHCLKEQFKQGANENTILAIGDIDDFKVINDQYGHICGDAVLVELAHQMRRYFSSDVFLCRWGGEEFIFIFKNMTLLEVQKELADFCQWLECYPFKYQNITVYITMTFGLSEGCHEMNLTQWIDQADQLLYKGKHKGKNIVIIH